MNNKGMGETVFYDKECPVCGEVEDYEYTDGNPAEPTPDEAYCNVCQWNFMESAQHYPSLKSIVDYRQKVIANAKEWIEKLENLSTKQNNIDRSE